MKKIITLICIFILSSCGSDYHAKQIGEAKIANMTVGKIQRELKIGMPTAEVIMSLGSPNIVTKDKKNKEVWVYDRLSTDFSFSKSGGDAKLIIFGAFEDGAQAAKVGAGASSGVTRLSQKTLTLIIKMTANGEVEDFTYHASAF